MTEGQDLEYYVHFEGYNRRIDKWVLHKDLVRVSIPVHSYRMINKMTEELGKRKAMEEEEKNEGAGFLENDEDAGMDEKQVTMHEQATKIKTIEWVQIGKFKCETWYFSPYPEQYHHID